MKKKNTFFLLVLFILTAFLVYSFINKKKTTATTTQLTFWHGIESAGNAALLKEKIADFEKNHPQIKIKLVRYGAADQVEQKIITALAGNRSPDLMWWGPQSLGQLAKTGKLLKIQDKIEADTEFRKEDIYQSLWEMCKYQDQIYTVPFDTNNLGIYYNKKLFKKVNIDPAKIKTWDQLLSAAKKLTNKDQYGFQVPVGTGEWTVWTWQTFLWAAGGEFLNKDQTKAAFDSAEGIKALQFWADLLHKHKVAKPSEPHAGYKTEDFIAGRVAMMINGPWNMSLLQKAEKEIGFEYGSFFIPKLKRYATNIGGELLYIFKSDPEKEKAAWEFSKFIMSAEFQRDWSIQTGYLPVCVSATKDQVYQDFLKNNPFIRTYVEQIPYGKSRPPIAAYNKISRELGLQIEQVLYQKKSAKKALKEASEYANKILSK
ncbi:MAG: ABC transporter substrate-binding protein [bacterium]|nr:ABC transporter substrate-binding protein [bacterium]